METQVHTCEQGEMAALLDFYRAVPPTVADDYGVQVLELNGALVKITAKADVLALNRVVGLGLHAPADDATLDRIVDLYTKAKVPRFFVQVAPGARPTDLVARLRDRGFEHYNNWVRLVRSVDEPPAAPPWDVRFIGADHAQVFGSLVARSFGWPDWMGDAVAATVGRPGWQHCMAFDGERAVGTSAFHTAGSVAWFDCATTDDEYRGRGVQKALIAARVRAARAAGCSLLVVETAEQTPEKQAPSYRNMLRFGFRELYLRPNYILRLF